MSSQNINIATIPSSIRKSGFYFEFNTKLAGAGLPSNAQNVVIVAPMTAAGEAVEKDPLRVFDADEAAVKFGRGSVAHIMAKRAFIQNPNINLSICGLDDASGSSKAAGTLTLTGTATKDGILTAYVGIERFQVSILKGEGFAAVTAKMKTAFATDSDLGVVITEAAGVITLTAKNAGTLGKQINFETTQTDGDGILSTFTPMTGGAVDADVQDALDAIFGAHFHLLLSPYNTSADLVKIKNHFIAVSAPLEQRRGHGIASVTDLTIAAAQTLAEGVNHQRVLINYITGSRFASYEYTAAVGAIFAKEEDPAMPLKTLPILQADTPTIGDRLSRTEQESLLASGLTPLEVEGGEVVRIVRARTTYSKNDSGIKDETLSDFTIQRVLDFHAYANLVRMSSVFGRSKLTARTPDAVRDQLIDVARSLEALEILTNVDDYLDYFVVEKDIQDFTRLDARVPSPIVVGFHVLAVSQELYFPSFS